MSLKAITILNGGLTAINQFSKCMNCLGYCAEMYVCEIVLICGCKNLATLCDFQQYSILTKLDSDQPLQPIFKLRSLNDVHSVA